MVRTVFVLCNHCGEREVRISISSQLIDPATGLPTFAVTCAKCKEIKARDGMARGYTLTDTGKDASVEIRNYIAMTQVRHISVKEYCEEMGICVFGRSQKDLTHPVCKSCQDQGETCTVNSKEAKQRQRSLPTNVRHDTTGGVKSLTCFTDLRTPNDWTNKKNGQKIYRKEREHWFKIMNSHGIMFWGSGKSKKRRMSVTRYVPDERHLYRDRTNEEGSMKPLEDAMVRAGIFHDDERKWLDRLPLKQVVDPTLDNPIVNIIVTEIESCL